MWNDREGQEPVEQKEAEPEKEPEERKLEQVSAGKVAAEEVELEQSAVVLAQGKEVELEQSAAVFVVGREVSMQDSRAVFLLAPSVKGSVRAVFTFWSAMGLGIGLVMGRRLLRLIGRLRGR